MSRFNEPAFNSDNRKALEQRARAASQPAAPEKKGSWPFSINKTPYASKHGSSPAGRSDRDKNSP